MRRKDREITDGEKIREIIEGCGCLRLGLCDDEGMYIVPLNFGAVCEAGQWYFYCHGASAGRKYDCIQNRGRAAFEMDRAHELVTGREACEYSYLYESIIGDGTVEVVEDPEEKKKGLDAVMNHYGRGEWHYDAELMRRVAVFKIRVLHLSCKAHYERE